MEEISMMIPDFQKLLHKTKRGGQFKLSDAWFIFQRKIISEVYGDFVSTDAFKIYIYLCKHFNRRAGVVRKGKVTINKDLKYVDKSAKGSQKYSQQVTDSLTWLEKERFIYRVSGHKSKRYRSSVLVAPDFNFQKQKFSPCDEFKREPFDLKNHQLGYIMIPKAVLKNSALSNTTYAQRKWTERKLRTLLLLYAYCWPEYHGGIDPKTVKIDHQGNLSLSERFCYALKSSQQTLRSLSSH